MRQLDTVLVVGAGASKEVGLPVGSELKGTIAQMLNIKFANLNTQSSGEVEITDALRSHVREADNPSRDINPYLYAGWRISEAMPQSLSIDNFIDAHNDDERIEVCGKLAIVRAILHEERRSLLFFSRMQDKHAPNYRKLENTWYIKFWQLLTEGCTKEDIAQRLGGVSFIIFNYDRCIEHFLYHALQTYYGVTDTEAAELLSAVRFFHPYGKVGPLPWEKVDGTVEFGANVGGGKLLSASTKIRTFTQRVQDETSIHEVRDLLSNADKVVFLGFAFHSMNMKLIEPSLSKEGLKVFATAFKISDSDCSIIRENIIEFFKNKELEVTLRNNLPCGAFFDEYWRSLAFL